MTVEIKNNSKKSRLAALSTAALALPGMPMTASAAQPTETTLSYRFTQYRESTLNASDVTLGVPYRYNIDVHQYGYSGPLGDDYGLSVSYQNEVLSGASPWSNAEDATNGGVDVVMSGASIEEHRQDASVSLTKYRDGGSFTGVISVSDEDDYTSTAFGLSMEKEFHNKQTVVATGFSMSDDSIKYEGPIPSEATALGVAPVVQLHNLINPLQGTESKESQSVFLSASRILSPNTIILGGVSWTSKSGYLHDAYKAYDQRPDSKDALTFNVSYRRYVKSTKTAWHFDYRYYDDDWGVDSHTYEMSMYRMWNKVQLVPSIRYYVQSSAAFYEDVAFYAYNQNQTYFSDDARLSDYGAISVGLKAVFKLKPVDWVIKGEYYSAKKDLSLTSSDNSTPPGLIEFTRFTFGIDHRF